MPAARRAAKACRGEREGACMKRAASLLVLLICLVLGALRWVDLLNYSDLATGFVTRGEFWWRYAALGGALVLLWLGGFLAPRRPACMLRPSPVMGLCSALCAVAWAAAAGVNLTRALAREDSLQLVLSALYALTALWLFLMAASRLTRYIDAPSGSALAGIVGTASFYLLAVYRFGFQPASLSRIHVTVEVLSALAALLFVSAAVRASYLPFTSCGRRLTFMGGAAFLLCTCLEAPQTFCRWVAGYAENGDLVLSLALGCTGLLGAVCALCAVWGGESGPASRQSGGEQEEA